MVAVLDNGYSAAYKIITTIIIITITIIIVITKNNDNDNNEIFL